MDLACSGRVGQHPAAAKNEPFRAFGPGLAIHRASKTVCDSGPWAWLGFLVDASWGWSVWLVCRRHQMLFYVIFLQSPKENTAHVFGLPAAELAGSWRFSHQHLRAALLVFEAVADRATSGRWRCRQQYPDRRTRRTVERFLAP